MSLFNWFRRPFASQAINPVMRDDHAQHFRELNALLSALDNLRDNSDEQRQKEITTMLRSILDEMAAHFRRELELMECYGYPGKESHQTEHAIMIQNLEHHYEEIVNGAQQADEPLINMMKDWMTTHIRRHDLNLNKFLSTARPVGKLGRIVSSR